MSTPGTRRSAGRIAEVWKEQARKDGGGIACIFYLYEPLTSARLTGPPRFGPPLLLGFRGDSLNFCELTVDIIVSSTGN